MNKMTNVSKLNRVNKVNNVPERGVNPAVGVHHRVGDLFNNAVNRVPWRFPNTPTRWCQTIGFCCISSSSNLHDSHPWIWPQQLLFPISFPPCQNDNMRLPIYWRDVTKRLATTNTITLAWRRYVVRSWMWRRGNWYYNIAEGTTDPRFEFWLPKKLLKVISQVLNKILIICHLHNLN